MPTAQLWSSLAVRAVRAVETAPQCYSSIRKQHSMAVRGPWGHLLRAGWLPCAQRRTARLCSGRRLRGSSLLFPLQPGTQFSVVGERGKRALPARGALTHVDTSPHPGEFCKPGL